MAARVTGIHVNWTAPFFAGFNRTDQQVAAAPAEYALPDPELLTSLLSALMYRELYGPIVLYTDSRGAKYYEQRGLLQVYDGVDTQTLDALSPTEVDPARFWAAGRFFAVRAQPLPFVLLDTDLVPLRAAPIADAPFAFAHWELPVGELYPGPAQLPPNGLDFSRWDWTTRACNMAFASFANEEHRAAYCDSAIRYATRHPGAPGLHPLALQLFSEQRIVALEAARLGLKLQPLLEYVHDPTRFAPEFWRNELFHHTWTLKSAFKTQPGLREEFCLRYLLELLHRFPAMLEVVRRVPELAPALRRLKLRSAAELSGRWSGATAIPALLKLDLDR